MFWLGARHSLGREAGALDDGNNSAPIGQRPTNIFQLQQEIDKSLNSLFTKEQRFMSHLTIARIKHSKSPDQFMEYINQLTVKPISFTINNFKLISSELKPRGPTYKTLKKFKLD